MKSWKLAFYHSNFTAIFRQNWLNNYAYDIHVQCTFMNKYLFFAWTSAFLFTVETGFHWEGWILRGKMYTVINKKLAQSCQFLSYFIVYLPVLQVSLLTLLWIRSLLRIFFHVHKMTNPWIWSYLAFIILELHTYL